MGVSRQHVADDDDMPEGCADAFDGVVRQAKRTLDGKAGLAAGERWDLAGARGLVAGTRGVFWGPRVGRAARRPVVEQLCCCSEPIQPRREIDAEMFDVQGVLARECEETHRDLRRRSAEAQHARQPQQRSEGITRRSLLGMRERTMTSQTIFFLSRKSVYVR